MNKSLLLAACAALLVTGSALAQDPNPNPAVGVERGKYGDPNALVTVTFAFAQNELTPASMRALDNFASQMDPATPYEIGGHTDSVGPDEYNLWLSEQRARAVRSYLVNLGASGSQLNVVGYGEAQPIDSNRSITGRARNRRVVIKTAQ